MKSYRPWEQTNDVIVTAAADDGETEKDSVADADETLSFLVPDFQSRDRLDDVTVDADALTAKPLLVAMATAAEQSALVSQQINLINVN